MQYDFVLTGMTLKMGIRAFCCALHAKEALCDRSGGVYVCGCIYGVLFANSVLTCQASHIV